MKFLVVGLGSIARRHINNIKILKLSASIAVWHQKGRENELGDLSPLVEQVFYEAGEALDWKPNAALITNPSNRHIETASLLAESGIHLFVEKPISHSLNGVDDLIELCKRRSLKLMVGYNFRFYPPFQEIRKILQEGKIGRLMTVRAEVGQYLPDWRPGKDYRTSVSAKKELGGGVVLELSHELDYIRSLAGEIVSLSAFTGKLADLEIDVEDTAVMILRFASGALGTIHLDMTDRAKARKCRFVGTEGSLLWDGSTHHVDLLTPGKETRVYSGDRYDPNQMYLGEMRHFIDCVEKNESPVTGGEDGKRILQLVLAAKRSEKSGQTVSL